MRAEPAPMADLPEPPDPVARPAWAHWLWVRKIEIREAGRAIGRSHEWVRTTCLPFDDPRRTLPDIETAERIEAWTRGEITLASFHGPAPAGAAR